MADTLARLDIQITSTAKSSMDAINAVQQKVEGLSRAMTGLSSPWVTSTLTNLSSALKTFSNDVKGVDTKGLSSITRAVDNLGTAASKLSFASSAAKNLDALAVSLQHISTMEFGDLSGITKLLSSVARVSGAATGSADGAISSLTTSLSGLAAAGPMDFSNIIKLINSVKKLDAAASANLTQLATALSSFSGVAIADLSGLNSLINSITRLSASTFDPKIFKSIGDAVAQLASRLRRAPEINANLIKLLNALARFGSSSLASAPANIDAIGDAVARMVTYLDALPAMHEDIVRFVEAIAAIAPHMRSMTSAVTSAGRSMSVFDVITKAAKDTFKQFGNIGKKVVGIWKDVTKTFSGSNGFLSGPVGSLLRFAATFLTLQRAWEALKSSISNASALVEIQNVINAVYSSGERAFESMSGGAQTAAEHLDELAKEAIHAYGMSELAFKEYASQFQAMGTALGITNEQVAEAEANLDKWGVMVSKVKDPVTGLNKEFGVMTGQMSDLSFTMTQLAGDIASFYDKDVADVQKALASGIYAGQTRPLTLAA